MEKQNLKLTKSFKPHPKDISIRHQDLVSLEFESHLYEYEKWLRVLGYAKTTVYYFPFYVKSFMVFLESKGIFIQKDICNNHVSLFIQFLSRKKNKRTNTFYSPNYLYNHINALKRFSRYLRESHGILFDPSLRLAKGDTKEPIWLSQKEISQLYNSCEKGPAGNSDRTILAVFYGLGLRRSEGTSLNISDIHFSKGFVHVRQGKNNKERFVPMSLKVHRDLKKFTSTKSSTKPEYAEHKRERSLFISSKGSRLTSNSIYNRLQVIARKADIHTPLALHTLRHSIATHLFEKGMSLNTVSSFLGHSNLDSTQIYTHLIHQKSRDDEAIR